MSQDPALFDGGYVTYRGQHFQVDSAKLSGRGLSPAWPANLPPGDTPATLGAKRQGQRTATLTLEFTDHGTCDVNDAVWRKYTDGQRHKVEVRASSGDVVCSSL